jgi:hypothetical protein
VLVPSFMAESIDPARTCNRFSCGTARLVSWSLSRKALRSDALRGGRSVSIVGIY